MAWVTFHRTGQSKICYLAVGLEVCSTSPASLDPTCFFLFNYFLAKTENYPRDPQGGIVKKPHYNKSSLQLWGHSPIKTSITIIMMASNHKVLWVRRTACGNWSWSRHFPLSPILLSRVQRRIETSLCHAKKSHHPPKFIQFIIQWRGICLKNTQ